MKKVERLSKEFVAIKQQIKELESKEAVLRGQLMSLLPEEEKVLVEFNDKYFGVLKTKVEKNKFNLDLFKSKHPQLYKKFLEKQVLTYLIARELPKEEQIQLQIREATRA